jgi:5-methylcytosine-specific restriction endonuclease McrA
MKRTPLKRYTPLTRKTQIKRTPLKTKRKTTGVSSSVYKSVLERDKECKAQRLMPEIMCWGRLDPHHILRRSQGGQDTPDNLVTLCRAHHSAVHEQIARSYELGLLKRREQ